MWSEEEEFERKTVGRGEEKELERVKEKIEEKKYKKEI